VTACPDAAERAAFIRRTTHLQRPPAVPEVQLHLADAITPMWEMTQEELDDAGVPPPFWAFAWAGGQAVARHLLLHPELVAGRSVLDLASGSGICALVAALAGAAAVTAVDVDPFAGTAIELNAAANGVSVTVLVGDLLDEPPPAVDVILAGDVAYEQPMATRVLAWLAAARAAGADVLLGDPGRDYRPRDGLTALGAYDVPTTADLEGKTLTRTTVFRLDAPEPQQPS
jgi:predicted nicotinamide N-methyase